MQIPENDAAKIDVRAADEADGPEWGPALLRSWLDRAAAAYPDKPYAISVEDGRVLSYGRLREISDRVACYLAAHGIGPNDRVALLANNCLEHLAVYLGVLSAGATICTVHVEMNRNHLDALLPALAPRLLLCETGLALEEIALDRPCGRLGLGCCDETALSGLFAEATAPLPRLASSAISRDDAVIYFTSGTSARPKGVILTYRELLTNAVATAEAFEMGPGDRIYDYRSFNWASAQILSALAPLYCGATLLLGRKFSRSRFFSDIAANHATIAAGNPTVLSMLLQGPDQVSGRDLPDLRFITSSSAPLLVEEWRRFEARFGIAVAQGYGSSETGWIAGCTDRTRRFGSVGRPAAYHRAAIVDREGRPLPCGEIGFVEIGGLQGNAFRYIGEDGAIAVNAVGRTRTGDMGYLDAEGYLYLTGRERDLIIRGGVNISPLEIDNALMELPGVVEAATIGVPDPTYGEEVASYVVLEPASGLAETDIQAFCTGRLAAFKAPKQIVIVASLPKTERGKLDRKAVSEIWRRTHAQDQPPQASAKT